MKERPILFSAAMVRAILEGRKTQTRRVMRSQPYTLRTEGFGYPTKAGGFVSIQSPHCFAECPYGVPGDRLWVRETLGVVANWGTVQYAADSAYLYDPDMRKAGFPYADECEAMVERWGDDYNANDFKLIPSIFMPRWASRITLEITDVRVQRVQEISSADAADEGVEPCKNCVMLGRAANCECPVQFRKLWDSINGKTHPWANNDWVWALTFKALP